MDSQKFVHKRKNRCCWTYERFVVMMTNCNRLRAGDLTDERCSRANPSGRAVYEDLSTILAGRRGATEPDYFAAAPIDGSIPVAVRVDQHGMQHQAETNACAARAAGGE